MTLQSVFCMYVLGETLEEKDIGWKEISQKIALCYEKDKGNKYNMRVVYPASKYCHICSHLQQAKEIRYVFLFSLISSIPSN